MKDPCENFPCHGPADLHAACLAAADQLHQCPDSCSLKLGLYVRAGCGLHECTRKLAMTTMLCTALLRQHFPENAFLTLALLRDPRFLPHRDLQNEWLPNLVIELRTEPWRWYLDRERLRTLCD